MELTTDQATITRNMQSLRDVPDTHILTATRLVLLNRAEAGDDVRAYGSAQSPTGIINLWDTDTRIPFYPLVQERWILERHAEHLEEWHAWGLPLATVNGEPERAYVILSIERHTWEQGDTATYLARASRVVTMVVHYINLYQDTPTKYEGCHF